MISQHLIDAGILLDLRLSSKNRWGRGCHLHIFKPDCKRRLDDAASQVHAMEAGPCPNGAPLMAPLGPSCVGLLWAGRPLGPYGSSLGPYGPGPDGVPWALMGRAVMGPLGPHGLGPDGLPGRPWSSDGTPSHGSGQVPLTCLLSILPMRNCQYIHMKESH